MQKSKKSELAHELEKHLSSVDYTGPLSSGKMAITHLVDVMAHIRKASLKDILTFGKLIERTVNTTNEISPRLAVETIYLIPLKIKECAEQMQRNPYWARESENAHANTYRYGVLLGTKRQQNKTTSINVWYNQTACIRKWKLHGYRSWQHSR